MCTAFEELERGGSKSAEKLSQTLPMTLKSCTLSKSIILTRTLKELTDEGGKARDERQKKEIEAL